MVQTPIVIDTDPGEDDAVALLMALARPDRLSVQAITAVAGNVPLPQTVTNALKIVALSGRSEVPVYAGCPGPMLRDAITAEVVHGADGMAGADLPDPSLGAMPGHAVTALIDLLRAAGAATGLGGGLTLCLLGPMTNLATALIMEPSLSRNIREIVIMGGAMRGGNSSPVAEFNILADPHAARLVFASGAPIVMLGLDVTHQVLTTPERLAAFDNLGTRVGATVARMLAQYGRFDIRRYGFPGGPLHDPCAVAYLLEPELFSGRRVHVDVETESALCLGQTVVDWWGKRTGQPNALVIDRVDADKVYALILDCLRRYRD